MSISLPIIHEEKAVGGNVEGEANPQTIQRGDANRARFEDFKRSRGIKGHAVRDAAKLYHHQEFLKSAAKVEPSSKIETVVRTEPQSQPPVFQPNTTGEE